MEEEDVMALKPYGEDGRANTTYTCIICIYIYICIPRHMYIQPSYKYLGVFVCVFFLGFVSMRFSGGFIGTPNLLDVALF